MSFRIWNGLSSVVRSPGVLRSAYVGLVRSAALSSQAGAVSEGREERLFQRVDLELRAHQPDVLKSYAWFIETTAKSLDVPLVESEQEEEPHKTRKTLLKSVFVHSKHRVQYEMRTYYWTISMATLTESTRDTLLEYIQRNLPEAVAMRVVSHEMKRLPEPVRRAVENRRLESQTTSSLPSSPSPSGES